MAQPWCRTYETDHRKTVECSAVFECEYLPEKEVCLVIEYPELYTLFLNGKPLDGKDCGSWHCSAWRKLAFSPALLKEGKNILSFRTEINNRHPGLESMFLLGDFGVRIKGTSFVLTPSVRELACGSWGEQGLPCYPGKVTYKTQVSLAKSGKSVLHLPDFNGTPAEIRINGNLIGKFLFSPGETAEIDLPETFELQITLTGSMRNACGPFFLKEEPVFYGPFCYKAKETDKRYIAPYGLFSDPEIKQEL
jgi:hypothetical protein